MTVASSLAFPGSRALAGWWRQLAPYRPEALWVGHLFLHHVEALACVKKLLRPDPFTLLVLRALALEGPAAQASPLPSTNNHRPAVDVSEDTLQHLGNRLHLDSQVLLQTLRSLAAQGLAQADASGRWAPSELGGRTLETGEVPRNYYERRVFHFVEGESQPDQLSSARPAFLHLPGHAGEPWPAGTDWTFDVGLLRACLQQLDAWKQGCGFPGEVETILGPETPAGETGPVPGWQRVVLDRPEHLLAIIARVPGRESERKLFGFAVQQDGWILQAAEPAFVLDEACADALVGLRQSQPAAAWLEAWQQWCQQRCLPAAEADACSLEPVDFRLRVVAPARLLERLRAARSDALKGEAWLLAGEGRFRNAARLDVVASPKGD